MVATPCSPFPLTIGKASFLYLQLCTRLLKTVKDPYFQYIKKNKHTNLNLNFWCLTPLSAISWRPVLVMEEAGVNFITCGCESNAPFFLRRIEDRLV